MPVFDLLCKESLLHFLFTFPKHLTAFCKANLKSEKLKFRMYSTRYGYSHFLRKVRLLGLCDLIFIIIYILSLQKRVQEAGFCLSIYL